MYLSGVKVEEIPLPIPSSNRIALDDHIGGTVDLARMGVEDNPEIPFAESRHLQERLVEVRDDQGRDLSIGANRETNNPFVGGRD